jgi:hypothetical protein
MLNRRQFARRASSVLLLLLASGTSLFIAGCNVFSDILNWIPVGEAALNSVLSVLTGNGVIITPAIQSIVALIKAGFTALTTAVNEYQSTTPPPTGALAKIETAFKDIVDNFSTFLSSLNVSGSLLGIITGLAQVVLSTIGAFVNRLPASTAMKSVSVKASNVTVGGTSVAVTPKARTAGSFKHDWDAILKSAPADVKIPPNAIL